MYIPHLRTELWCYRLLGILNFIKYQIIQKVVLPIYTPTSSISVFCLTISVNLLLSGRWAIVYMAAPTDIYLPDNWGGWAFCITFIGCCNSLFYGLTICISAYFLLGYLSFSSWFLGVYCIYFIPSFVNLCNVNFFQFLV